MPNNIKVYTPRLSVIAWHGTTKYDLTPYVLQAVTHKSLDDIMGQFALLLTFQKQWDQYLDEMDYVEIKMSRYSATPQIRMRGFISNIRRTKTIDQGGTVRRTWTINGNDYGKLFKKYQIYYAADTPGQITNSSDVDPAQMLLAPLLSENFGVSGDGENQALPLANLIPDLVSATVTPWIKALQKNCPTIPDLVSNVNVLSDYQLNWLSLQSMQGGMDSIINTYANLPWCEWFVYDSYTGPMVIHRNTPFKDQKGNYIFSESVLPSYWTTIEITDEDVIEDDVGTSDSEMYDYFFTYPSLFPNGDLAYKFSVIGITQEFGSNNSQSQQQAIEESLTTQTNPKILHDSIYKYGLQIMEQASPAIPIIDINSSDVDPLSARLSIKMNMWLVNAYGWAPQMKNGTLSIKANENITFGRYLKNKSSNEEYYIESVDDVFTVSQIDSRGEDNTFLYQQTLGVTRGCSL